eukprot:Clim_evm3s225 gene=Clim_evmTU3s225
MTRDFCGPMGWGPKVSFVESDGDETWVLTPCFTESIMKLGIPGSLLIITIAYNYFMYLRQCEKKPLDQVVLQSFNVGRYVLVTLMILCNLSLLAGYEVIFSAENGIAGRISAPLAYTLIIVLHMVSLRYDRMLEFWGVSVNHRVPLGLFWGFSLAAQCLQVRNRVVMESDANPLQFLFGVEVAYMGLLGIVLILEYFTMMHPTYEDEAAALEQAEADTHFGVSGRNSIRKSTDKAQLADEMTMPSAYTGPLRYFDQKVTIFNRSVFWWIYPVVRAGSKKILASEDLGRLPTVDRSEVRYDGLKAEWDKQTSKPDPQENASLWVSMWQTSKKYMTVAGICKFIGDMLAFVGPLAINQIVQYAEELQSDNPITVDASAPAQDLSVEDFFGNGYVMACTLFIAASSQNLLYQQHHHLVIREGIRQREALQSMVFRKALRVPLYSKGKIVTGGEMINHLSIDPIKVMFLFYFVHYLWAAPLQATITIILLYSQIGVAGFIGALVVVALIPIQMRVAAQIGVLQKAALAFTDVRLKLTNELLQSIKIIKLQGWELPFEMKITEARERELKQLMKGMLLNAFNVFIMATAPTLVTLVSFGAFTALSDEELTATRAFTSLALIQLLQAPLFVLPMTFKATMEARVSAERLRKYYLIDDLPEPELVDINTRKEPGIIDLGRRSFAWDQPDLDGTFTSQQNSSSSSVVRGPEITLTDVDIRLHMNSLNIIIGTVGAGKSSLLLALVGEVRQTAEGDYKPLNVFPKLSVAYCAQKAWIRNATIRKNILFGESMDENRYRQAIEMSGLGPDIETFPAGEETEIGERGINLSGGQKQRVALARAFYFDADVYLLDDPLSALDAHVGRDVFMNGVLELVRRGKTVVLVTHQLWTLEHAAHISVLEDGMMKLQGNYHELLRGPTDLQQYMGEEDGGEEKNSLEAPRPPSPPHPMTPVIEANETADEILEVADEENSPPSLSNPSDATSQETQHWSDSDRAKAATGGLTKTQNGDGKLIKEESKEEGVVRLRYYLSYTAAMGFAMMGAIFAFFVVSRCAQVATDFWLTIWSDDISSEDPDRDTDYYIMGYGLLSLTTMIFLLLGTSTAAFGSRRASRKLHADLLASIVRGPMVFFDSTPMGRIMNRFSADTNLIDQKLMETAENFLRQTLQVLAAIVVNAVIAPFFLIAMVPLSYVYFKIQKFFRHTSRELQRLDSVTRSPFFSQFSETVDGLSTVRAYHVEREAITNFHTKVDVNTTAFLFLNTANRWLGTRLDLIGATVVFSSAICVVILADSTSPSDVGFAMAYALQVTSILNWLIRSWTDTEMHMNAVERVVEYRDMDVEQQEGLKESQLPENWPNQGRIEFKDLSLRYRKELDPAVRNLSMTIASTEKVGVCGRTGSGKSTLTLGLFRMIDLCNGDIIIDGVNIRDVALETLRRRIGIIPQDPALFMGTVRYNLDPFDEHTDAELWEALRVAQLDKVIAAREGGLTAEVSEDGENYSHGQRQLICMARALAQKCKILIMDEATATVDPATDAKIQEIIRTAFAESTVITIAHRLDTILDYDRILVMGNGSMIEYDAPGMLLSKPQSEFSQLVSRMSNIGASITPF